MYFLRFVAFKPIYNWLSYSVNTLTNTYVTYDYVNSEPPCPIDKRCWVQYISFISMWHQWFVKLDLQSKTSSHLHDNQELLLVSSIISLPIINNEWLLRMWLVSNLGLYHYYRYRHFISIIYSSCLSFLQ